MMKVMMIIIMIIIGASARSGDSSLPLLLLHLPAEASYIEDNTNMPFTEYA